MRIKDLPSKSRPRERLLSQGSEKLSNQDLIAILLRTGTKGSSALGLADSLLTQFKTLGALAQADLAEIEKVKGIGPDKAVTLKSAFTLANRMAQELQPESPIIDAPSKVADLFRLELREFRVETCFVLLLNSRNRLVRTEQISSGTLDTLFVHPREVFQLAILHQAASVALVHNHPSGDPSPSQADIRVTLDLVRAGKLLKIDFVDHVIIGHATKERQKDYCSLRELGHIPD